jgi:hypothetical protein
MVTSCFDYDVMLHVNAPKPFSFETNLFQKQRKCNKLKIQCFVDEYGIYFTRETGFFIIFFVLRIREIIKNPVSLVK